MSKTNTQEFHEERTVSNIGEPIRESAEKMGEVTNLGSAINANDSINKELLKETTNGRNKISSPVQHHYSSER